MQTSKNGILEYLVYSSDSIKENNDFQNYVERYLKENPDNYELLNSNPEIVKEVLNKLLGYYNLSKK